ncbi:MAG TPA: PAS domain S-box protein [Methanoregula sp.]|nr:PAS domain S-box protein [Methanoregula sp.]
MYSLLYVDDEPSLLELAKIFLERTESFSVTTKISAKDGLDALKNGSFDAIISDFAMPGMDGIEFLKIVRAEKPAIPFILFTGKGREEIAIEAIDNGADFYIQKGGQPKAQFAELAHKIGMAIKRRLAEQSLRDSEQRYKAVVEDQTEFICRFNKDGTYNFVNDAFCRYFQKKPEDLLGKKYKPKIPAKDLPDVRSHFASLTRDNPTAIMVHQIILDDGEVVWHRWSDRAIFNDKGELTEYQSVGRDITRQKKTELELADKKDYLDLIFSSVKAGIVVIDAKTHVIVDINPAAREMMGVDEEEIIGKVCHRFICPAEAGKCPITDLGQCVDNSERTLLTVNGVKKSIIKHVIPTRLYGRNCLLETFLDNTQRKQALEEAQAAYGQLSSYEKELKQKFEELRESQEKIMESEKVYRAIFENTGTATMIIDEDKTITLINSRAEQLSGYLKEELEGKRKWTEFVDREDLQRMIAFNDVRWKSPEKVPSQYEFRFSAKDSSVKHILLSIGLIPGTKKAIVSLLDITDYKRMEKKLQESEDRLRILMEKKSEGS